MSVFVDSVDADAAWEVYYRLADRRHQPGLTTLQLRQVIEAALVGKVEAEEETGWSPCTLDGVDHSKCDAFSGRRFRSPWVEVEEHL